MSLKYSKNTFPKFSTDIKKLQNSFPNFEKIWVKILIFFDTLFFRDPNSLNSIFRRTLMQIYILSQSLPVLYDIFFFIIGFEISFHRSVMRTWEIATHIIYIKLGNSHILILKNRDLFDPVFKAVIRARQVLVFTEVAQTKCPL